MNNDARLSITIDANNRSQKAFKQLADDTERMERRMESVKNAAKKMALAGTAAVAGLALGARKLIDAAAEGQRAQQTFDALNKSIGSIGSESLDRLKIATRGMVDETNLMLAGNKFMAMGLASTQDEMSKLAEISTRLGTAMGNGATESMENFALMMANQSILRLDSFGISSGKVRERILELMASTEGMTREMAFNAAVMEQAEVAMDKLGDPVDTVADRMDRMKAQASDLQSVLGTALFPAVEKLLTAITPLITRLANWAAENPKVVSTIFMVVGGVAALAAVVGTLTVIMLTLSSTVLLPLIVTLGAVAAAIYAVREGGTELFGTLKEIGEQMYSFFEPALKLVGAMLKSLWGQISGELVPAFQELWEVLSPILMPVLEAIGYVIGSVIVVAVMALVAALKLIVQGLTTLLNIARSVVNYFASAFSNIWDVLTGKINVFEGAINSVKHGLNLLIDLANEAIELMNKVPGVDIPKAKRINVDDAVISPSGQVVSTAPDDWLIATKTPHTLGAGGIAGGGVTVNVTGGNFYGIEDLTNQVEQNMMLKLGSNTRVSRVI